MKEVPLNPTWPSSLPSSVDILPLFMPKVQGCFGKRLLDVTRSWLELRSFEGLYSVASTIFAGLHMATSARQDIFPMSAGADFAGIATTWCPSFNLSELATVGTLVVRL